VERIARRVGDAQNVSGDDQLTAIAAHDRERERREIDGE